VLGFIGHQPGSPLTCWCPAQLARCKSGSPSTLAPGGRWIPGRCAGPKPAARKQATRVHIRPPAASNSVLQPSNGVMATSQLGEHRHMRNGSLNIPSQQSRHGGIVAPMPGPGHRFDGPRSPPSTCPSHLSSPPKPFYQQASAPTEMPPSPPAANRFYACPIPP